MTFHFLTIFPSLIAHYFNESLLRRAQEKGLLTVNAVDLRKFTQDKHHRVDDAPYGGGAGMLMKVEPVFRALQDILGDEYFYKNAKKRRGKRRIILLDPSGVRFDQKMAENLSHLEEIVFVCGRYEGFDQRIAKFVDQRVSIGPYVLSGGELPSLVIAEAVSRNIHGVLGNRETLVEETFSFEKDAGEYPQYTRPETFVFPDGKKLSVPKILLSGDHGKIKEWRIKRLQK